VGRNASECVRGTARWRSAQRRAIELAFRSGELLGMVATNALELGS
jgi:ATP-dependent helicase YprA (DUF1998 family)